MYVNVTESVMAAPDAKSSPGQKSTAGSPISKSMSPYINSPNSAGKLSPKGRGPHISTMKSLGLLHDLQEYITTVEAHSAEQKQELERLKEEKRDIERSFYKMEGQDRSAAIVTDFFKSSELADMPPRIRALVEDNKTMKEKLRRYKSQIHALDQQASFRNSQIMMLEDAVGLLKQQLAACSQTPADVATREALQDELQTKTRRISNLEHEVTVLRKKLETDSKLHSQSVQGARREQDALKRQVVLANASLEEQDKELRAARLEIKRLSKFLVPVKGSPPRTAHMALTDDKGLTGTEPQTAVELKQRTQTINGEPIPTVHLMLCLLHDHTISEQPASLPAATPAENSVPSSVSPVPALICADQTAAQHEETAQSCPAVFLTEQAMLVQLEAVPPQLQEQEEQQESADQDNESADAALQQTSTATDNTQEQPQQQEPDVSALQMIEPASNAPTVEEATPVQGVTVVETETPANNEPEPAVEAASVPELPIEAMTATTKTKQERTGAKEAHVSAPKPVPYRHTNARLQAKAQAVPRGKNNDRSSSTAKSNVVPSKSGKLTSTATAVEATIAQISPVSQDTQDLSDAAGLGLSKSDTTSCGVSSDTHPTQQVSIDEPCQQLPAVLSTQPTEISTSSPEHVTEQGNMQLQMELQPGEDGKSCIEAQHMSQTQTTDDNGVQ